MKNLVQILCLVIVSLIGANAYASGAIAPTPTDNGHEQCKAYDTGFEEHGYHNTCSDCLKQHGACEVRCFRPTYSCKAEGRDRTDLPVSVDGVSREARFDAEGEAMDRCYNLRLRNCHVTDCNADNNLVSTQSCR